jgi:hypothetical protein
MTRFVIRAVCFAAAVCACFAQDDIANLHLAPRRGDQSDESLKSGILRARGVMQRLLITGN